MAPGSFADEGSPIPKGMKWLDTSGNQIDPLSNQGQKVTVLFFLTAGCSIGNGYAPEIARIIKDYRDAGVRCFGVFAHESSSAVASHLKEFKLPLTPVLDPQLLLAKFTGASVTPEACVLSPAGELLYRGRIDDRAVKIGTVRNEPRVRDLRLALDEVLAGRPVATKFTKAVGCYIDFSEPTGHNKNP